MSRLKQFKETPLDDKLKDNCISLQVNLRTQHGKLCSVWLRECCVQNKSLYGHLEHSSLQEPERFLPMHSNCHDIWLLYPAKKPAVCKKRSGSLSHLPPMFMVYSTVWWPTFSLKQGFRLRFLNPSQCYHQVIFSKGRMLSNETSVKTLTKLLFRSWPLKSLFEQDKLFVHDDKMMYIQAFRQKIVRMRNVCPDCREAQGNSVCYQVTDSPESRCLSFRKKT